MVLIKSGGTSPVPPSILSPVCPRRTILCWERKIQVAKETERALDPSEVRPRDLHSMSLDFI